MRGTVLDGRYTLVERVGSGGMGVVWRAHDARLERHVAVKLLRLPADTPAAARSRAAAMFVRESRAAAALESAYIVPVFDYGSEGDDPYLVMPLLSGRTVRDLLADGRPLSLDLTARVAAQTCRALEVAHRAGIVHRDIKPANVMVTGEGVVQVLDFGIAKFLDATTAWKQVTTETGTPAGTLRYMAPERLLGESVDGRTDVYSCGVMLYEMLVGRPPFATDAAPALIHSHVYEPAPPVAAARPDLPPGWGALVAEMLAKGPDDRPAAGEVVHRLAALQAVRGNGEAAVPAPAPPALDAGAPPEPAGPASSPPPDTPPAPPAAPDPTAAPQPTAAPAPAPAPEPAPAPDTAPDPPAAKAPSRRRAAMWVTLTLVSALVAVLVVADPFGGDSSEGDARGSRPTPATPVSRTETLTIGTAQDSKGPAAAVKGASEGGTLTVAETASVYGLDPANVGNEAERALAPLVFRTLTTVKTLPDGSTKLVGDLATDPGRMSDGGRTWSFTLKAGVTYEDGSPITSRDIAHGIERSLDTDVSDTTSLLLPWLLGEGYALHRSDSPSLPGDSVETPSSDEIVFHLPEPRTDFNLALTDPAAAPVPLTEDAGADYGERPVASGPYKLADVISPSNILLVRNPGWSASTDPVRHAYPDRFRIETGLAEGDILEKMTNAEPGRPVITLTTAATADIRDQVGTNRIGTLEARPLTTEGYVVDTKRLPDVRVRRALVTAFPPSAADPDGPSGSAPATHLIPPGLRGSRDFDLYQPGPDGDPAAARALLEEADAVGTPITVGSTTDVTAARDIATALDEAGFEATVKEIGYGDVHGAIDPAEKGDADLYPLALTATWPTSSALFTPHLDATSPYATLLARLDDQAVRAQLQKAKATEGFAAAAKEWAELDRMLMERAVMAPTHVPTHTYLHTKDAAGLTVGPNGVSALTAYVVGEEKEAPDEG
ncbi:ABC transporter substrate-binding protein [Streptomyces sp. WMMC500]|uniref:protein kinase domain-containing protein n=1 Tax=Streptomyces sp. WMMC500 TaxID=3015154 RepID=UPI00248CED12|nr:ABC transporter substrate-binding protein [Streptomyces sp. WMMC500]WBB58174.1 ABC transporter substrate-binding protein [Streptomyces sp. WMMC500]